jgi:DNA-binding response OmpR family regulator
MILLQFARMAETVLIIEDEPDVLELVVYHLQKSGFKTATARDGNQGLQKARDLVPALVVLDLMLPGLDGTAICKQLKADPRTAQVPILMLTAKAEEVDRILGLELGADDYITKPFSPRELVLRIKRLLRAPSPEETSARIQWKDLTIDPERHEVAIKGKAVELTATEFKLLTILAQRRGRVQSRESLLQDVWDYESLIDTRTVDVHMRRLREKMGPAAKYLDTVRGVGYRFVSE